MSFLDIVWFLIVIAVAIICAGINWYSTSYKERRTQFYPLWFMVDGREAVSKRVSDSTVFEA